jgi:hypothetical protein
MIFIKIMSCCYVLFSAVTLWNKALPQTPCNRTIASCGFLQQKQEWMLVKYAIQSRTSVGGCASTPDAGVGTSSLSMTPLGFYCFLNA